MTTERELLKGNTPTLILAVLRDGPLHGYAIAREIERRSERALKFKEGTLYPTLHSLEEGELVSSRWERNEGERERKVYTLTDRGLSVLEERSRAWDLFADAVNKVLVRRPGDASPSHERQGIPPLSRPLPAE